MPAYSICKKCLVEYNPESSPVTLNYNELSNGSDTPVAEIPANETPVNINKLLESGTDDESDLVGHDEPNQEEYVGEEISERQDDTVQFPFTNWHCNPAPNNIARTYRLWGKQIEDDDNEELVILNKVSAYNSEKNKAKFKFDKSKEFSDQEMCVSDDRNVLEVMQDIVAIACDMYDADEVDFLSQHCGYNVAVKQTTAQGLPMPPELVKELVKEYKIKMKSKSVNKILEEQRELEEKERVRRKGIPKSDINIS